MFYNSYDRPNFPTYEQGFNALLPGGEEIDDVGIPNFTQEAWFLFLEPSSYFYLYNPSMHQV